MNTPTRAVFLSYASQDAGAAQRICQALQAAGIEVWFDQSGLRGGEAWDRKIREQIQDCALFIPVISATTHARVEGYFRLEWKLAIDRSHLMAPDQTFLLPVVIDDTPQTDRRIPERFRELQWSLLPDGQVPATFIDRVRGLLSPANTALQPDARERTDAVAVAASTTPVRRWLTLGVSAAVAAAALVAGSYVLRRAPPAESGSGSPAAATVPSRLPAHTVAVLPFDNLSAEVNDAFLAAGIAESVLHRLAAVKSLAVIARTSSFTFRGRDVDARDIGRKLNARYLVTGSVQRSGERLRVTAQLLDADSGSNVWSLRFERRMDDVFQLEDEISDKVADALAVSLQQGAGSTPARHTPKLDAYLAYLEGRSMLATYKIADIQAGIERLRRATEIDPTFAAAYAEEAHGLRLLHSLLHPERITDVVEERRAAALVDKALAIDPELGEAWVQRAYGRAQLSDDPDPDPRIEADFRKGLALAPNYAQGYELYGEWLTGIGRTDDALAMIERARQLDPLAPRSHYFKGVVLLNRGEIEPATALFIEALRVNPTYHPALTRLGALEHSRGNFAEAVKLLERAIAVDPQKEWIRWAAARSYFDLADVAAAQDVLATVPHQSNARLCISAFQGETQHTAAELLALPHGELTLELMGPWDHCASLAIRDDALKRRDYDPALRALKECVPDDWAALVGDDEGGERAICALHYASLLIAAGQRDRATKILRTMLEAMDRRTPATAAWVDEARFPLFAMLGDTDRALSTLEAVFATDRGGWWEAERTGELEGLRGQPRFQRLVRHYHDVVARESALLAGMRRSGEVPYRPARAPAGAKN